MVRVVVDNPFLTRFLKEKNTYLHPVVKLSFFRHLPHLYRMDLNGAGSGDEDAWTRVTPRIDPEHINCVESGCDGQFFFDDNITLYSLESVLKRSSVTSKDLGNFTTCLINPECLRHHPLPREPPRGLHCRKVPLRHLSPGGGRREVHQPEPRPMSVLTLTWPLFRTVSLTNKVI